jgi:hypothetical protein
VARFFADRVGLPLVLGEALVDLLDYIEPDWGGEDGGEREGAGGLCDKFVNV